MGLPAIGALLSGGAELFSAFSQNRAQQDANNINWRAVLDAEANQRKQEELATASRTDAYGNKVYYTPGIGWQYALTPSTTGILSAEQREQLANLNQDAPRNRAAAVRQDTRSQKADDEWNQAFAKYKYRSQPSEEGIIADTRQTLLNSRKRGLDEAASLFAKQLLRTGDSSNLASVYKDAADQYADSLQDVDLKAKQIGSQQFRQERDSDEANAQKELEFLRSISDDSGTTPVHFSNFNQQLSSTANDALSDQARELATGDQGVQQALARYAQSTSQGGLDLTGVAKALAGMFSGGGKDTGRATYTSGTGYGDNYFPPRPVKATTPW